MGVVVAAAFAVVAFGGFGGGGGVEGREGFVVLEVGLVGGWGAGVVAAARAGVGFASVARAGWDEVGEEVGWCDLCGESLLLECRGQTCGIDVCRLVVGVAGGRLQSGEAVVVLELEVGRKLLRSAIPATGESELLHHRGGVVGEETAVSRDTIPLKPVLAHVVLRFVGKAAVRTCAVAACQPVATDDWRLVLARRRQGARCRRHVLADEIGGRTRVSLNGGWPDFHDRVHRLSQIVPIGFEERFQLLITPVVLQDRAQHIVGAHLRRVRGHEFRAESSVPKAGITTGVIVDQPVDSIAAVIAVVLGRRG